MEKKWEEMSADEKQEAQFQKLLTPKDPEGNDLKFHTLWSTPVQAALKAIMEAGGEALKWATP